MPVSLNKIATRFSLVVLCVLVAIPYGTAFDDQPKAAEAQQMEQWWADLAKPEPEGSRALLKFAFKFEKSVPFFKQKMKPARIEAKEVKALLEKLGSEKEEVWKPAYEELDYYDPRLAIDLVTLMNDLTDKRATIRLVEILCGHPPGSMRGKDMIVLRNAGPDAYNFFDGKGSWWAESSVRQLNATSWGNRKDKWTRAVRAILLLDQIGSADALAIIREMATGHAEAEPTRVAKDVLAARAAKK